MKKIFLVILIVVPATGLLAGGAFLVDHWVSRSDRLAATAANDALITVRDQVLRYQWDHGVLPRSLDELVPAYVRMDQIERDNAALYVYLPTERRLRQSKTNPVRGLVRRKWPAWEMTLPEAAGAGMSGTDNATASAGIFSGGVVVLPKAPTLPDPPVGTLVFEAEHWTDMNWGWEIHPDATSGGGAYIHSWEGKTNGPAQLSHDVHDFYDVRPASEHTSLKYRFHLDRRGTYYIYARMWTTDTHCSNSVSATVDAELREEGNYLGNTEPFQWIWSMVQYSPFRLEAGDHYLNIFIHEDGLRIDQFMLSPAHRYGETRAFRANDEPGTGTAWQKTAGPPAHISFDVKSAVLSPATAPDVKVALRRLRPATGRATLRVSLEGAGLGGKDWRVLSNEVDLAKLPEVLWVPLSFAGLKIDALDRREYMLRAELTVDGKAVATARETMLKPFLWEAIGPLDFMENSRKGPFDGTTDPDPRDSRKWLPIKESSLDHFGVLDFGLHATGNSANAPTNVTVYARTRVSVPETGEYVLLIQSDDAMLLWVDGKRVYQFEDDYGRPVTRSAARRKVPLDAGQHEIRMRVNQVERFWQASVRVRNGKDDLCNVVGLPLR